MRRRVWFNIIVVLFLWSATSVYGEPDIPRTLAVDGGTDFTISSGWQVPMVYVPLQFSSNSPQFMFETFEPLRLPRVGECLMLKVYEVLLPTASDPYAMLRVQARFLITSCPQ